MPDLLAGEGLVALGEGPVGDAGGIVAQEHGDLVAGIDALQRTLLEIAVTWAAHRDAATAELIGTRQRRLHVARIAGMQIADLSREVVDLVETDGETVGAALPD